jgi:hypothetical protein
MTLVGRSVLEGENKFCEVLMALLGTSLSAAALASARRITNLHTFFFFHP